MTGNSKLTKALFVKSLEEGVQSPKPYKKRYRPKKQRSNTVGRQPCSCDGIARMPSNEQSMLLAKVTHVLDCLSFRFWGLVLTPRYIGHDLAMDTAARALCHAMDQGPAPQASSNSLAKRNDALKHYGQAVRLLRTELESPTSFFSTSVLLTISLLSLFEAVSSGFSAAGRERSHIHWRAMEQVLLARPRDKPACIMTRGCVYNMYFHTFFLPGTNNTVSPFDDPWFLALEPPGIMDAPPLINQLKKTRLQMQIRLPRLLQHVRAMYNDSHNMDATRQTATYRLCHELLQLTNEDAENFILHNVSVVKTQDPGIYILIPYAFKFLQLQDLVDAVLYWHCRLVITRLALTLISTTPSTSSDAANILDLSHTFPETEALVSLAATKSKLLDDQSRLASNILMSWPWAFEQGPMVVFHVQQPLVEVWRAMDWKTTFRGLPREAAKEWIRKTYERVDPEIYNWDFAVRRFSLDNLGKGT